MEKKTFPLFKVKTQTANSSNDHGGDEWRAQHIGKWTDA
jgi:hypothetical protein